MLLLLQAAHVLSRRAAGLLAQAQALLQLRQLELQGVPRRLRLQPQILRQAVLQAQAPRVPRGLVQMILLCRLFCAEPSCFATLLKYPEGILPLEMSTHLSIKDFKI